MVKKFKEVYLKQQERLEAYRSARRYCDTLWHQHVPLRQREAAVREEKRLYEEWWIGSHLTRITISKITD